MRNLKIWISCMSVSIMLLAVAGCTTTLGTPIPFEKIQYISPGKTTRSELIARFGSPIGIVGRTDSVDLPVPSINGFASVAHFPGTAYTLHGDTFFTLFPETKQDNEVIYCYYFAVSNKYIFPLLVYWEYTGATQMDYLWILVNKEAGIVKEYAYKQYGQNTVFSDRSMIRRE